MTEYATREGAHALRTQLLLWLAGPLMVFLAFDAYINYQAAASTAQHAYDRLLVTSTRALADLIYLERGELQITLPHAALEIYESIPGNKQQDSMASSRMVYRVSFLDGHYLAGDKTLPPYTNRPASHPIYQSMVDLYDLTYDKEPMRVAALLQPVESYEGMRLVVVQVGESSRYRDSIAGQILRDTVVRQGGLLIVLLTLVWTVTTLTLRPLRRFAGQLDARQAHDLTPVFVKRPAQELQPLIDGFNGLLSRLAAARSQQRRFVADASHQLRTPLAVLQLQADAGLRGDIPAREALASVALTTQRATRLAEQLLSLARAQQTTMQGAPQTLDLRVLLSEVVIELSPLIARKHLDFQFDAHTCEIVTYQWMVREIVINLLKNAIEFTPEGRVLGVRLLEQTDHFLVQVWDSGPGLSAAMQSQVFTPFASDQSGCGAGLGLAICQDLATTLGGRVSVENISSVYSLAGMTAQLRLPR